MLTKINTDFIEDSVNFNKQILYFGFFKFNQQG